MIEKPYFAKVNYTISGYTGQNEKYAVFETAEAREAWVTDILNSAARGGYTISDVKVSFGDVLEEYEAKRIWEFKPLHTSGEAKTTLTAPHTSVEI